jgi:diadenosine tetraphosphatase ApaH/serine/threonine PP2A family protein phosphatase
MRVAIATDIHGNRQAFEAVIAAAEAAAADELWCLGDLVGYGADPDACVELAARHCTICLAGNHDLAVTGTLSLEEFSRGAALAARWTQETITQQTRDFLLSLQPQGAAENVGLYHASPRDPIWEYVLAVDQARECMEQQSARVSLIGHSHVALWFSDSSGPPGGDGGGQAEDGKEIDLAEQRWLLNPGSVGQPRDGDPRAAWLMLDPDAGTASFRRVEYDVAATQEEIRERGLPDALAQRLAHGV